MATVKRVYPWNEIKADIELGKTKAYIHKKYDIPYNSLSMKCKRESWIVVNEDVTALSSFKQGCEQVSELLHKADTEEKKNAIVNQINTIIEDNDLIVNNRRIAKLLQGVIANNKHSINLQNIKTVSGVIRDIEAIANPQANKQEINIQNTNATQINNNKSIDDFYEA